MKKCPIHQEAMEPEFKHEVLGKYEVQYYRCPACGLIQTEEPYWLDEAYSNAIATTDTGIMERNLHNALRVVSTLYGLGVRDEVLVDMAGGYGILTRLLRDAGFNARWTDEYCDNVLAKGLQVDEELKTAEVLCAFEVLEHVEDPVAFLGDAIGRYSPKYILCSTELVSGTPDMNWWYYAFGTGQHISFYSESSMHALAEQIGMNYFKLPRNLHLFTQTSLGGIRRVLLTTYLIYLHGFWALLRMRKSSKTVSDNDELAGA